MARFLDIDGIMSSLFRIGLKGPFLRALSGGEIEHRLADDSNYAITRGGNALGEFDLTTLKNSRQTFPYLLTSEVHLAGCNEAPVMGTIAPGANVMVALPFVAPRPLRVATLRFAVSTAALSGNGRVALYASTSFTNPYPSTLLVQGDAAAVTTTGAKIYTVPTPYALTAGQLYWVTYYQTGTATVRGIPATACIPIGGVAADLTGNGGVGYTVAYSSASYPATFPAGATVYKPTTAPALGLTLS